MNKYIKDKHIINATEKAYNTIYKAQGYLPYGVEELQEDIKGKKKSNK